MSGEIEQLSQEQRLQVMNLMEQEELPKDKAIARVCGEPYTPDMETIDVSQPAEEPEPKQGSNTEVAIQQNNQILPERQVSEITMGDIKDYICPQATEKEAYMFLKLCQARNLNPFTKEAYLLKYGGKDATMVVGKDAFTRRAEEHPQFDGFQAGIIVVNNPSGDIERREGTFTLRDEVIVGGWSKVYRKDRSVPYVNEVSMHEYDTGKSSWAKMPATMIRKVALVQSLREAFPSDLGGLYDSCERGVDL